MNKLYLFLGLLILAFPVCGSESVVSNVGMLDLGYLIGIGIAACGVGIGQGRAASAALEGISRNPAAADKIQGMLILSLALMESLVIFTIISIFFAK